MKRLYWYFEFETQGEGIFKVPFYNKVTRHNKTNMIASDDRAESTLLYSVSKGDFKFNISANLDDNEKGGGVML
ncbi:MAG: hypothetical protein ACI9LG_003358, partial [Moritella dasanensis]